MRHAQTAGGAVVFRPLSRFRKTALQTCAAGGCALILAGCVATQEDIQTTRAEMTTTTATIQQQFASFKETTETRQGTAEMRLDGVETRLVAMETRLAAIEQSLTAERAAHTEALETLRQEIRALTGKINEVEFGLREIFQKTADEQERRNAEFRRDIESLRKVQNDLLPALADINRSVAEISKNHTDALSRIQSDLLALKEAQGQMKTALEQHLSDAGMAETAVIADAVRDALKKELTAEFDRKMQILLSEVVRQESALTQMRVQVAELSRAARPPATSGTSRTATAPATQPSGPTTYTVQPGDTLTGVARKYGTTVEKLRQANPRLGSRSTLLIGEKLTIPR